MPDYPEITDPAPDMAHIVNALDAIQPDWVESFATSDDASDFIRGRVTHDQLRQRLIHNLVWTIGHAVMMAQRRRIA